MGYHPSCAKAHDIMSVIVDCTKNSLDYEFMEVNENE